MTKEPYLYKREIHFDERGAFSEVFNKKDFPNIKFIYQNHSISLKNVMRGFHAQIPKQNKLVRCVSGKILDHVFDPFTEKLYSFELNNPFDWVFVPKHCLHAFTALEDSQVHYLVDRPYSPNKQIVITWKEIDNPSHLTTCILSERDKIATHTLEQVKELLKREIKNV